MGERSKHLALCTGAAKLRCVLYAGAAFIYSVIRPVVHTHGPWWGRNRNMRAPSSRYLYKKRIRPSGRLVRTTGAAALLAVRYRSLRASWKVVTTGAF